MKNMKFALLTLACLSQAACSSESHTYNYLVEHPLVLNQDMALCQSGAETSPDQQAQCEVARKAAVKVGGIIDQAQSDPERFGQLIMQKEDEMVKSREQLDQANSELVSLKAKNASAAELAAAETKVNSLEAEYQQRDQDVKIMLAVAGLNSPE